MKIDNNFINSFNKLSLDQNGVFTLPDLNSIISPTSKVDLYRQIKKLTTQDILFRLTRGIYITSNFSIETLVVSITPEAYLSLEYALAYHNMIGTYANKKIRPIITSNIKPIEKNDIIIEFKKIQRKLVFGFNIVKGIRIANKEKALLDTLYFYQSGTKFYFDIYSDIDIEDLDRDLIQTYLKKYKNPKFVKFVEEYLNG